MSSNQVYKVKVRMFKKGVCEVYVNADSVQQAELAAKLRTGVTAVLTVYKI